MGRRPSIRCDVIAPGRLRSVLLWPGFPVVFQALGLLGMVALAVAGWGVGPGVPPGELLTLRKTNLTTLVVWGLWWPGVIALALTLGRAWCTVCPAELANRLGDALARRVGWPRARVARWVRAGWLMVLAYLALQLLVAGVSVHRVPHATSLLLLTLLGAAFVTGLVFRGQRSFCQTLCPVNPLLSVYGRFTPVQLDVRDRAVCERCPTKDCVQQSPHDRFDRRSCPSLLRPHAREQGDGCVLCFQCAKVCPHENVGFGLVRADAGARRHRALRPFEAAFVMVAAGFVTHELAADIAWLDEIFHVVPRVAAAAVPGLGCGWTEALWFLGLYPLALWTLVALVAWLVGGRQQGWRDLLVAAATGAAPVVALAHLAKAAAKATSWAGYLPGALTDPAGLERWQALSSGAAAAPAALVARPLIGWLALAAVIVVGWRSWRWTRAAVPSSLPAARAGLALSAALFTTVLLAWTQA